MNRLFQLFNKLGKRERFGVIAALLVAVYFVMEIAFLAPEQKQLKAAKADFAKLEGEVAALRNEMVVVKAHLEKDPFAKDRAQLDSFKRVVDEANAFLAKVESDPKQVGAVLRQLIASTPGVTFVSLKTLPVTAIIDSKGGGAKPVGTRTIYRRGIEVTIRGNYLALLPYLEKLQAMPTRVLWSDADLVVGTYPDAMLRLTVYTLSSQGEASIG